MLRIIQNRKIYFIISGLLCLLSILSLCFWGLKPGIDFTGGTLMEIEFSQTRPLGQEIKRTLTDLNLGNINVQEIGDKGIIMRMKNIDEETHQKILKNLEANLTPLNKKVKSVKELSNSVPSITETRFETFGPSIGQELKEKTLWTICLAVTVIVLYITWAFRKVAKISYTAGMSSWTYSLGAIIALCHDILITTGFFSVLGHFAGVEINILFVTALLTILGYSVNDTIVVYDRTRENLGKYHHQDFETTVNQSINETIIRSINTSLTTLLILLAIFVFGGTSIKYFALALILGIFFGTYSSIFVASALLVAWQKRKHH